MQKIAVTLTLFLITTLAAFGQNTGAALKPLIVTGEVVSVESTRIVIKTDKTQVVASLSEKTEIKRVSPDNPSLKAAIPALLPDIGPGDKIAVTGILDAGGTSLLSRAVYLMSKAEIAKKRAKESEEWRSRGITGRILSINPQTNEMSVEIRTLMGSSTITVSPKSDARFLRYAPDSIRFDEAKPSSLAETQKGDMIRALGDRSADGTGFAAEQIVTGAFQTIAGTVKSVDSAKSEVVIKDLNSGKDVTIIIGSSSILKRFPAEMAERLAGAQGQGGVRPVGAARPASQGEGRPAQGNGRPGRGSGSIDEMIERFPDITAADLKTGDMIAISSTKNGNGDRIRAIKLLAGVEPFLRMAQASGGQRGQSVQGGFSIPGLDGIGLP
jgi:hypothetical protein